MKTALQEVNEMFLKLMPEDFYSWVWNERERLLELEKKQIVEAYKQGIAYWNGDEWKLINIEQYYNETFKNTNK
jgi:hypothetical protein